MPGYHKVAVDDRQAHHRYYAAVAVEDENDMVDLVTSDASEWAMQTRMTVDEANNLIASLQEAVTVAELNR